MRLLLDVNVPRFAAVSAYKKIAEETTQWGPASVTMDVLDWGPPPYERLPRFIRENISYVPALALNANAHDVSFFTYDLLKKEVWNTRPAIDWANRDLHRLFGALELECPFSTGGVLFSWNDKKAFERYLNSIPTRVKDEKLSELVKLMGPRSSRDCCHVWFCDFHRLDGLLTMDKTFIGKFNQTRKKLGFRAKALSPKEVCQKYRINAAGPEWFAARADPHIIYQPHQAIPVGEYLYTNDDAERLFSN